MSQSELDIDEGHRTVAEVLPELKRLGLRAASPQAYAAWLDERRGREGRHRAVCLPAPRSCTPEEFAS